MRTGERRCSTCTWCGAIRSSRTRVRLGAEALVEITGLRTPCSQIDGYRTGLQKLLWGPRDARGKRERRAGVMAVVLRAGDVLPGDALQSELPPEPHLPLEPV